MTRPVVLTLAAALGGVLLLAGCNRDAPTPAAPPAPTAPEPPPAPAPPAPATVTSVELGNAVDDQNRVSTPASEFATTDTIYASVGTEGESAAKLAARWTFGEGQLVRNTEADVVAGPQVIAFDIHHPEGWPVGTYKLEVSLDGTVVETREFSVK
ncbi:hypothetical protein [Luteimonas sp. 3794]|uniref:hypothetical protein n=1 Tax=Luteimonas sp. 3794 TaxID=2817730 RepID=UPI0028647274|nr:hypothetical protein [Luteimonas sp. 3794]MDR6990042.1 hypothetical protein [Luteimonas sp. 3794]